MEDTVHISLRYIGPEVDDGEMDINEVVSALQGFAGAYAKVSSHVAPDAYHQLKVTAIRESSFDLFITAAIFLSQSGGLVENAKSIADAAKYTFELITNIIRIKKHTKSELYTIQINGNNNSVNVVNAEKVELAFPLEAFEMFRNKLLDADLSKITDPLREGRINAAELKQEGDHGAEVSVDSSEKSYFKQTTEITKEDKVVTGTLVSLNKETNRGTFKFGNGKTARYAYVGENKDKFHQDFSRKGPILATATVEFDENLTAVHLDIRTIEPAQAELSLTGDPG